MFLFLFKKYRYVAFLLGAILISMLIYGAIFAFGHRSGSLKMQAHYQQILLKQAQEHQAKQADWLKQAEQINRQQLDLHRQTQQQTNELKKEIHNVIAKDRANGVGDCTFGDHSLQHYKKSLGYE